MVARWLENYFQFRGPGLHRGLASLPDARRWQRADAAHTGYTERLGTRLVPGRREDRLYLEQPPQCHECGRDWGSQLLTDAAFEDHPSWSPDGRIVFFSNRGGHLYVINGDGNGLKLIGDTTATDETPSWS